MNQNKENAINFQELQWDTEYFGVTCAKVVINRKLTKSQWDEIIEKSRDFQFISIENKNSEAANSRLIETEVNASLVDVNVQFVKKLDHAFEKLEDVKIHQAMERLERIIEISDFQFSKFIVDSELSKRGGADVYRQWLISSFGKQDKFFAVFADDYGVLQGYLLHSYSDNVCTIELIAVSSESKKYGIGTKLMKAVEYSAKQHGCDEIKVGTQLRNEGAINLYHMFGYKQVGSHQVYHLWNL